VKLRPARNEAELSRHAAAQVLRALRQNPDLLLGVATGSTPTLTYARLAIARAKEPALFRRLRVLTLDEWLGLPRLHPGSCEAYVRDKILGPLGVDSSRYQGWRSTSRDPRGECRRMARWLHRNGPLDLAVLGLGQNGHLLMNEPGPALDPAPHVARLAESTRRHPMLRSTGAIPRFGLTVGLADILRTKAILLLVSGHHKRAPLKRMVAGQVSTRCPASFLWLHPDVTVHHDRASREEGTPSSRRSVRRTET
jgi:galactosamine-6-phosphate isomerase